MDCRFVFDGGLSCHYDFACGLSDQCWCRDVESGDKNPEILTNAFDQIHLFMINQFGIHVFNPDNVSKISDQVLPFTQKTLGSTMSVFGNILLMYLVLYFLLVQTRDVELWLKRTLPFKTANTKK
ncbi:MAG: hypothetical protein IPL20_05285 [Saprospiraceae bacterium]|nr:hypothetical protein [Saprospiraceae bacterium]